MRRICADIIERLGFTALQIANTRCVPESLLEPTRDVQRDEILEEYGPENTFTACTTGSGLRWTSDFQVRDMPMRTFVTPSLYRPHARFESTYAKLKENHSIHGVLVRAPHRVGGLRSAMSTALVFAHGWCERSFGLEMRTLLPALFRELPGLDIYLMEQPYHMHRTPPCTPYSGSFFFDTTPVGLIESMRQGVSDVSQLVSTLRRDYENVVVMGISLGGHVLSYMATCDDRPDAYVMCQAGMSVPSMKFMTTLVPCLNRSVRSVEDARRYHDPISLTRFSPTAHGEKIITVNGVYDRLIPIESATCLARHFKVKHRVLYRGSHLTLLFQSRSVTKVIARRLREILGLECLSGQDK